MPSDPQSASVDIPQSGSAKASPQTLHNPQSRETPSDWRMGFWSLIASQFQGAFNDNALKFLVIYLIVDRNFPGPVRDRFILLVGALFALPFIFFSLAGGYLAGPSRASRDRIARPPPRHRRSS